MFSRTLIAVAAAGTLSLVSFASADTRVVITGHHNSIQNYQVTDKVEEAAPYTLTGREDARQQNSQYDNSIRVGNRIVVPSQQR